MEASVELEFERLAERLQYEQENLAVSSNSSKVKVVIRTHTMSDSWMNWDLECFWRAISNDLEYANIAQKYEGLNETLQYDPQKLLVLINLPKVRAVTRA